MLVGLVCLALAITSTVALIAKVVYGGIAMVVMAALCVLLFGMLWFVMPLRIHHANGAQPTGPPR